MDREEVLRRYRRLVVKCANAAQRGRPARYRAVRRLQTFAALYAVTVDEHEAAAAAEGVATDLLVDQEGRSLTGILRAREALTLQQQGTFVTPLPERSPPWHTIVSDPPTQWQNLLGFAAVAAVVVGAILILV